ncbi:radical SAM enzyme, Cfr family [Chlamydoabsidia padenii]|nr:radical SAM enzyme, Cfr family [Chlamydoabsidia padenii]
MRSGPWKRPLGTLLLNTTERNYSSSVSTFTAPSRLDYRKNLIGMPFEDLSLEIATLPSAKRFTPTQLWHHLYRQGSTQFEEMTNISKQLRQELDDKYRIHYGEVQLDRKAKDHTRKFLIGYNTQQDPGAIVETVLIPEKHRSTLCVSSQIGCSLKCSFCHTGTQKLLRNLTASEVVGQYMIAAQRSGDFPLQENTKRKISNMVFMGQGEPLYNWRNTSAAIKVLTNSEGLAWSKSKITVSTSGVVPLIPKLASELGVSLAISLHATNNDLRDELVPLNKTYPLEMVLDACHQYSKIMGNKGRRITFEYVMLDHVNDSLAEARTLVKLLKQLPAHVNLIPFNPWPGSSYETTKWEQIELFSQVVMGGGIPCTIRRPRGKDILAACGQLKTSVEQKQKSRVV